MVAVDAILHDKLGAYGRSSATIEAMRPHGRVVVCLDSVVVELKSDGEKKPPQRRAESKATDVCFESCAHTFRKLRTSPSP